MKIRVATFEDDTQVCAVAKQSKYTRDFTSHRFYRDKIQQTYASGEVAVAVQGDEVIGFVYCKHLKREAHSVIHFMGVGQGSAGRGVGRALLKWAVSHNPHPRVELSCEHSNEAGTKFYTACGWAPLYEGSYGTKKPRPYTRWEKAK